MTTRGNGEPVVHAVHASKQIGELIKLLHAQAALAGTGNEFARTLRHIYERLKADPWGFGEPRFRLPALRLQIRLGVVNGVVVTFGVHEDRPFVFIRGIDRLS